MSDKCEYCGKPWSEHLGIQGTCRLLKIARDELNDMDRQIDMRFKAEFELREMTADRDAWKAKAERYRETLEIMSRDGSLKWAGFIVHDMARAALQEDTP